MRNLFNIVLISLGVVQVAAAAQFAPPRDTPELATAVSAPEQSEALSSVPQAAAELKISRSFEELGSPRQALKLAGVSASYSFSMPVSPRERVIGGTLHIETTNSTALIQKRSELSVSVNGEILAQYQLDPAQTRAIHDLDLPTTALKPGYNNVRINVVQHYTDTCENPLSPELWTQLDGKRSGVTLTIAGNVPNSGPRLTQLGSAFDRRGWVPRRLAVVTGSDGMTESELSAAGIAVQGLGLRLDYRPLGVDVFTAVTAQAATGSGSFPGLAPKTFQGRDVLLVGKRAEIARYLDQGLYGMVSGPYVGVFSANSGDSVVIIVSGSTDDELMQAARSLGNLDYKYSDMPMERVGPVALPGAKVLTLGAATSFDGLGFKTQTLNASGAQAAVLDFRAPGNFSVKKGDVASLSVHFSYSAGLRKASNLDLYLNDTFVKSIALDNEQGGDVSLTNLKVPAPLIKPGYNTLSFDAKLLTASEQCDRDGLARGSLTVFEDSKLELPESSVSPKAPDLARFARSLWPYTPEFNLVLSNRKPDTAATALELLAFIAQKNHAAVNLHVSFQVPATGNAVIVGPFEGLATEVQQAWPLNKYQWVAEGSHVGVLQAVENKRVLTGFFARDTPTLQAGIDLLRTKGLWNLLGGTAAVLDTQEETIRVEGMDSASQETVAGEPSLGMDLRILFAIAAGGVAMLALALTYFVRKRIRSRSQKQVDASASST